MNSRWNDPFSFQLNDVEKKIEAICSRNDDWEDAYNKMLQNAGDEYGDGIGLVDFLLDEKITKVRQLKQQQLSKFLY